MFVEEARNIQSQKRTAYHRQVQQGFYWQRTLEALPLAPENLSNDRDSGEGEDGEGDLVKIQVRTKCKILIQRLVCSWSLNPCKTSNVNAYLWILGQ